MQQTAYRSSNATTCEPAESLLTPKSVKSYVGDLQQLMLERETDWDDKASKASNVVPRRNTDYNRPPPLSAEDEIAEAATRYYESLVNMTRLEQRPAFYFAKYRQVLQAESNMKLTQGYRQLTAATRGQMKADQSNVAFGIYAHLCNEEPGSGPITRNPATQQALVDYFEVEDQSSLPPVSASVNRSERLADQHSDWMISMVSIAYSLRILADCDRLTDKQEEAEPPTVLEGQWQSIPK